MNTLIDIPSEKIIKTIFLIRGRKVMFDSDLAKLYGVEIRTLNQAVKRNKDRFPDDFSFVLTPEENKIWKDISLRSQNVTLEKGMHRKYLPRVFTEQGVAMLSSVLKSNQAIQVNIQIIRTFTKLREILSENKKLSEKVEKMERKYDREIAGIFSVLKSLVREKEAPKNRIGFVLE